MVYLNDLLFFPDFFSKTFNGLCQIPNTPTPYSRGFLGPFSERMPCTRTRNGARFPGADSGASFELLHASVLARNREISGLPGASNTTPTPHRHGQYRAVYHLRPDVLGSRANKLSHDAANSGRALTGLDAPAPPVPRGPAIDGRRNSGFF